MAEAAAANGGSWTVWNQLGVQAAAVGIALVYAAVVTLALLFVMNRVMRIKSSESEEMAGLDRSYHGERGYGMLNPN